MDMLMVIVVMGTILFITRLIKNNKHINKIIDTYITENINLKSQIEEQLLINKINDQIYTDFRSAIEDFNNIVGKKYIKIVEITEEDCYTINKNIIIIIYESDIRYRYQSYYKNSDTDTINKDGSVHGISLECMVYIGNKIIQPLILSEIIIGNELIEIEDINLGQYTGKGVGTSIIQFLSEVVLNYGVNKIKAKISPYDYDVKNRLNHFYCEKNKFVMKKEVTRNSWGVAIKYIDKGI